MERLLDKLVTAPRAVVRREARVDGAACNEWGIMNGVHAARQFVVVDRISSRCHRSLGILFRCFVFPNLNERDCLADSYRRWTCLLCPFVHYRFEPFERSQ